MRRVCSRRRHRHLGRRVRSPAGRNGQRLPSSQPVCAGAESTLSARRGVGLPTLVAGGVLIFTVAALAGWAATRPPSTRAVRLNVVSDVVLVAIDSAASVRVVDGVAALASVSPGAHIVTLVRGVGCDAAAHAAWCGVERLPINVPPGSDTADITLTLAAPAVRSVIVEAADHGTFSICASGAPNVAVVGSLTLFLAPGQYPATAVAGPCAAVGDGSIDGVGGVDVCASPVVPPSCPHWTGNLVVPWSSEDGFTITLPLTTPSRE